MDTDTAEAADPGRGDEGAGGGMDVDEEDDGAKASKGGKREGRGKGKTSYSGTGKKAWFEMFPAVTKRSKNATKKRKGAVRG